MTFLLLPGRQIVNTRFQEEYLNVILGQDLAGLPEIVGQPPRGPVTGLVFAVTSANKSNSRYNPLPFEIRAILVYEFARRLQAAHGVSFHIVGVPHYPPTPRFASLVLKEAAEQSDGLLHLTPENTVVFTSTPAIIAAYTERGFAILPGEYDMATKTHHTPVPNAVVNQIGTGDEALDDLPLSASTREVFANFPDAVRRIRRLFHDPILTEQGDLTETRDYSTYTRAMTGAIDFKYADIKEFLRPGKIVDEGCADGALLERIAHDFPDSDLIGVDLSAEMLARAGEAKRAGAFGGAFVFFAQQNLMSPVSPAQERSVDTVICNSTLHELWSYGQKAETVRAYLRNKFRQLRLQGTLVIRDVVGPENGDRNVRLWCARDDGLTVGDVAEANVAELSTWSRFLRFCRDFRPGEERPYLHTEETETETVFVLPLRLAMEFLAKMDYTDNWLSEMHEEFCFWSFPDWVRELTAAGFSVLPSSHAYASDWKVVHSFTGKARLQTLDGEDLPWPVTNMVLAGEKQV